MEVSSTSTIDLFLVGSLSLLAVCFLIYIIFFIPVLIQLSKTLEAVQSLLNILKDYSKGLTSGLSNAGENFGKFASQALSTIAGIKAGLQEFFRK